MAADAYAWQTLCQNWGSFSVRCGAENFLFRVVLQRSAL